MCTGGMRPKGTAAELEARRRRAVQLLDQGWRVQDVAAAVGASRKSVYLWKQAAGRHGARSRGLAAKPPYVRACRPSLRERARLKRLLTAGPRRAGLATDLWTLPRVADLVAREFGVAYHPSHLGRLLHALGLSCQKPARRSREQDPAAVRTWREQTWPKIKKGGRGAS